MPSIQALRSDALAMRSLEDVKEKIPSFYNSVNQALGQTVTQQQDSTEQLAAARAEAANGILASLKQKIDGKGAFAEAAINYAYKSINQIINTIQMAVGQSDTSQMLSMAIDMAAMSTEASAYAAQFDAAAADYVQFTLQAGYGADIQNNFLLNFHDKFEDSSGDFTALSMGMRGAVNYRDSMTPRFTDRANYDTMYKWGSVGSISRDGMY